MNLQIFLETHGDNFTFPVTLVHIGLPDQPLIYVNKCFSELSQYESSEILGKNCRFLNRREDPAANLRIRTAIDSHLPICQDLLNYKKSGEIFYNRLVLIPFRERGVRFVIGFQHEIAKDQFRPMNLVDANTLMDRTMNPMTIMLGLDMIGDERFPVEFAKAVQRIRDFVLSL